MNIMDVFHTCDKRGKIAHLRLVIEIETAILCLCVEIHRQGIFVTLWGSGPKWGLFQPIVGVDHRSRTQVQGESARRRISLKTNGVCARMIHTEVRVYLST
jgi:hypothetical protein